MNLRVTFQAARVSAVQLASTELLTTAITRVPVFRMLYGAHLTVVLAFYRQAQLIPKDLLFVKYVDDTPPHLVGLFAGLQQVDDVSEDEEASASPTDRHYTSIHVFHEANSVGSMFSVAANQGKYDDVVLLALVGVYRENVVVELPRLQLALRLCNELLSLSAIERQHRYFLRVDAVGQQIFNEAYDHLRLEDVEFGLILICPLAPKVMEEEGADWHPVDFRVSPSDHRMILQIWVEWIKHFAEGRNHSPLHIQSGVRYPQFDETFKHRHPQVVRVVSQLR